MDDIVFEVTNIDDLIEACKYNHATIKVTRDLISKDKVTNVNLSSESTIYSPNNSKLVNISLYINDVHDILINNIKFTSNIEKNVIETSSRINIKDSTVIDIVDCEFFDKNKRRKENNIYIDSKLNDINILSSVDINIANNIFNKSTNCIYLNECSQILIDKNSFNECDYCVFNYNSGIEINEENSYIGCTNTFIDKSNKFSFN